MYIKNGRPSEEYSLTFYDITGRAIAKSTVPNRYLLDVNALPAGCLSNGDFKFKKQCEKAEGNNRVNIL